MKSYYLIFKYLNNVPGENHQPAATIGLAAILTTMHVSTFITAVISYHHKTVLYVSH